MSKIAKVEPIPVSYPEPNDFNALRHLCLVKITTDDGVVGWGESITQFPEANFAVKAIIEGMAERVVGRDPLENGAIWHSHPRQGVVVRLWRRHRQLRGRGHRHGALGHQGQAPEHQRAQPHRWARSTRSCPSSRPATPTTRTSGRWSRRPRSGSLPGLHGVKVGFGKRGDARLGYEHDRDVEYMRRMREGLGPKAWLMIDCGWNVKWDVTTAVRRVQAFEEFDLTWIEEPLGAWDPEGYANLRTQDHQPHRLRREGVEPRRASSGSSRPAPSTSWASTPAGPRASPASSAPPSASSTTAGRPTRMPGRAPSAPPRAWP